MNDRVISDIAGRLSAIDLRGFDEQTARFPMRFAKAVIVGETPNPNRRPSITTASATLVNLESGPAAITCQHVVARVLSRVTESAPQIFQIGNAVIDLQSQLLAQDEHLDVATIRLTPDQVAVITAGSEIGGQFFDPATWPCDRPQVGDFVAFGGFPAHLRNAITFIDVEFGTWSSGASRIDASSHRQFISPFERERWIRAYGTPEGEALTDLGGMSGGPVFILRGLRWDLVGIVKEFHEAYDTMIFAPLERVMSDGRIEPIAV